MLSLHPPANPLADKRDPQRPPGHDCVPGLRGAGRDDAEGPLRQPAGAPGGLQRVLWCMKFRLGAFSMYGVLGMVQAKCGNVQQPFPTHLP